MSLYQTIVLFSNLYLQVWLLVLSRWNSGISLDLKNFYSKYLLYLFLCKLKLNPSYLRQNKLIMMVFWTTSKTWPQILDPEKIGPWKPSTRKNLDHEKPVPWKTLALKLAQKFGSEKTCNKYRIKLYVWLEGIIFYKDHAQCDLLFKSSCTNRYLN